jgi:antitoxin component of RelBE/YafQ-DinJ toxin-antitoxin module
MSMKKVLHIYVDERIKHQYKEICKKIGLYPSLRIFAFVRQDIQYLKLIAHNPLNISTVTLGILPESNTRTKVPFNITIDSEFKDQYKRVCEEIGTSASRRIELFMEKDLERLKAVGRDLIPL